VKREDPGQKTKEVQHLKHLGKKRWSWGKMLSLVREEKNKNKSYRIKETPVSKTKS
jgi:hypothetical protein